MNILKYCRKLMEKSRSLGAALAVKTRDGFRACIKKARTFCAELATKTRDGFRAFIKRARAFCAAHVNIGRTDIFMILAVMAVLAYIVVNHSCEAVNEPGRINITVSGRFTHLFGGDAAAALIQEFETQYPNLRIVDEDASGGDSGDANTDADVVFFDDSDFGGATKTPAIALVSFMDLFVYNIDILQAVNLDRPPKTRADFLAAARAVKESDTVAAAPFALGLSPFDPLALRREFYPWIWANGVDIASIDLSEGAGLPRAVADIIAFFEQLNREELLAPETFEATGARRLQEFAEGKIAMMTISARDLALLKNNAHGITFGITALPAQAQGKNRVGLSGVYAGISGDSAVLDEAKTFVSFLAKKSDALAEAIGAVPGSYPAVFAGEYIAKDPLFAKAWEIFEAAEIVEYKSAQPAEEEFNRLVREKLIEAFKSESAPSR